MTGPGDVLELVLGKLEGVRQQGGQWMARCPAPDHDDGTASLSVAAGDVKPVLLHCFAGCRPDDVLAAIGLSWAHLSADGDGPAAGDWTPAGPAIATYLYTDAAGKVVMGVCRTADKQFRQWRPDPVQTARPGLVGQGRQARPVPAAPGSSPQSTRARPSIMAEGEKDVHALEAAGVTATCNPAAPGSGAPPTARPWPAQRS